MMATLKSTGGPAVRVCVAPELLVIPAPLMVSVTSVCAAAGLAVMVNLPASGVNTISATSVLAAETSRSVILEPANLATSPGPLGTVSGVQLAGLFQSLSTGSAFQVALPAWTDGRLATANRIRTSGTERRRRESFMPHCAQQRQEKSSL